MKVLNSYKICLSKKTGILCGFYKFLNVLFEIAQWVKLEKSIDGHAAIPDEVKNDLKSNKLDELIDKIDLLLKED